MINFQHGVLKPIQKTLYSLSQSKFFLLFCFIAIFITINTSLHLIDTILDWHLLNSATLFNQDKDSQFLMRYRDNIMKVDVSEDLCYEPMDVVYTWVNGSDMYHQYLLEYFTNGDQERVFFPDLLDKRDSNADTEDALSFEEHVQARRYRKKEELHFLSHSQFWKKFQRQQQRHQQLKQQQMQLGRQEGRNGDALDAASPLTLQKSLFTAENSNHTAPEEQQDNGSNRFRDNDELRYSLRSLEKYAPWVRNIYIVTSGQVPTWLDISNPRVHVVQHSDIFLNQSHLPVFSSPAIENNIHRIPGLSKRFIYLNDDVFFGNRVYPEDFFSKSTGQNVFLSWDVPDCAPGCSAQWIGDGYCDIACNNTQCDWDGGDCIGAAPRTSNYGGFSGYGGGYSGSSSSSSSWYDKQQKAVSRQCSARCPNGWVGDKFCDKPCNVPECGFDAGDCGVDDMKEQLQHYDITRDTSLIEVPYGIPAFYLNMSFIFPVDKNAKPSSGFSYQQNQQPSGPSPGRIHSGSHDNPTAVRTSTISQTYKILTMTLYQNISNQNVTVNVSGEDANGKNVDLSLCVYIQSNETATIGDSSTAVDTKEGDQPDERSSQSHQDDAPKDETHHDDYSSIFSSAEEQPDTTSQQEKQKITRNAEKEDDELDDEEDDELDGEEDSSPNEPELPAKKLPTKKQLQNLDIDQLRSLFSEDEEQPTEEQLQKALRQIKKQGASRRKLLSFNGDDTVNDTIDDTIDDTSSSNQQYVDIPIHVTDSLDTDSLPKDDSLAPPPPPTIHHSLRHEYVEKLDALERAHRLKVTQNRLEEQRSEESQEPAQDVFSTISAPGRRKLLDMFGDSLIHVNKLLNRKFGRVSRKVPAHMPHMIDRDIMQRVYDTWAKEFNVTSSNRFRSSNDMQYTFSYFYYMMHEGKEYKARDFFHHQLDRNANGVLEDYEVRYLAVVMDKHKINVKDIEELAPVRNETTTTTTDTLEESSTTNTQQDTPDTAAAASNTSTTVGGISTGSSYTNTFGNSWNSFAGSGTWGGSSSWGAPTKSQEEIFEEYYTAVRNQLYNAIGVSNSSLPNYDSFIQSGLSDLVGPKLNFSSSTNPYQLKGSDEIGFHMIGDNELKVRKTLDDLRYNNPKFICLNDDMNKTSPNPEVLDALHSFYSWYFPKPSQFELPLNRLNPPHMYIDELKRHYKKQKIKKWVSGTFIVFGIMAAIAYVCYKKDLLMLWNRRQNRGPLLATHHENSHTKSR